VKRFWNTAAAEFDGADYTILLDGKPMHLPGGAMLRVGPPALAQAIAEEWQMAGLANNGEMTFADTPLTRLAGTARERIAPDPGPTIDAIARYGETDLLCYRAVSPAELVRRQAREWQPWLDWAALTLDAPLRVTTGVVYIRQHQDSIAALRRAVAACDPYVLAGLGVIVPGVGSLVLGLALTLGSIDAAEIHTLGILDELFEEELWGVDAEAKARRDFLGADIAMATRFIRLAQMDTPLDRKRRETTRSNTARSNTA